MIKCQKKNLSMMVFLPSIFQMRRMRISCSKCFGNILSRHAEKPRPRRGEIIRIAGRVQHEFLDNGCINWDEDFHKMLDGFLKYLPLGNGFSEEDLKIAEVYVGILKESGDKGFVDERLIRVLCSCAMTWVKQNPKVIEPLKAEYAR